MTKLILCSTLFVGFSLFATHAMTAIVDDKKVNECMICRAEASVVLDCAHCQNEFCRDCASQWISEAINNSCPFCKQQITHDDVQRKLSGDMVGLVLARPMSSTDRLREKALLEMPEFSVVTGTKPNSNIPVVIFDGVFFAVIEPELHGIDIGINFDGYNLIILSDISSKGNLTIRANNLYVLGNLNATDDIDFETSEKLVVVGAKIHAGRNILLPPEKDQIVGNVSKAARLAFIEEYRQSLRLGDNHNLVKLMTFLVSYDGNK